jgi:hypothetical protein
MPGLGIHMGSHDLVIVTFEGSAPGEDLVQHGSGGIEIGARIDALTPHLLRRHVVQRSQDVAGTRGTGIGGAERHAEIEQLGFAEGCNHDVGRLDVAVDHPAGVRVLQRRQHLADIVDAFHGTSRPGRAHLPVQVLALHELHHHGDLLVRLESGVQLRDVGMRKAGEQPDFA